MTTNTELWATIDGYDGDYRVSTHGRVMSFKHCATGRLLKLSQNPHGYLKVELCTNNAPKTVQVHRLVTAAFIPNPENKPQCNHINGIKTDNNIENLEWVTSSENTQHAYDTGLLVAASGEQNGKATASDRTVALVREIYAEGFYTQEQLAEIFGAHPSTISRWVRNEFRAV